MFSNDLRKSTFEYRNPSPNPYLNRDALAELGPSALAGGAGGAGAVGEGSVLRDLGIEESEVNVLLLYMYMYGIVCYGDLTYYLAYPGRRLADNMGRMIKRHLCQSVPSSCVSYKSKNFYVANYDSDLCRLLDSAGIRHFYDIDKMRKRGIVKTMVPHTYGTALSVMLINLFCFLREGYDVSRVLHEVSISDDEDSHYVYRSSADATIDAAADVLLPSGITRTVNIEFDTGTERLGFVVDKFINYYGTPAYSGEAEDSAFYNQLILFSCNHIDEKVNKFRKLSAFEEYFRFFVRTLVCVSYDVGSGLDVDLSTLMQENVLTYIDSENTLKFNEKYRNIVSSLPEGAAYGWAGKVLTYVFPFFGPYIAASEGGGEKLRDMLSSLSDPSYIVKKGVVEDYYQLSDLCDAFGKPATDVFTLENMKNVLFSYLSRPEYITHPSEETFLKCPEPGILERKSYNRRQYALSFNRHIGIADTSLAYIEGDKVLENGDVRYINEAEPAKMVKLSALYKGYQVYTAATHLLNNHLSSILVKDSSNCTADEALLYVSSYIISRYGSELSSVSPDLYLCDNLGIARLRDCLVDTGTRTMYSVCDASIETSSLVRSAILQRHYSPITKGNEGYHIICILLANSFSEMRRISKSILFGKTCFTHDDDSLIIFALHPELDFGFRTHKPKFYACDSKGKILDFDKI